MDTVSVTLEREESCKQALNDQVELNLHLRIQVEDLQKRLEEKGNKFTEAQETIRILRGEVQSLQKQLDILKRKYLDALEQRPQTSHFALPDSEANSMACVDYQPTLTMFCESVPNPRDHTGQKSLSPASQRSQRSLSPASQRSQRSLSPALSCVSEPPASPSTYQPCADDIAEGDWLTPATDGKIEQHRLHEANQAPSHQTDSLSSTDKGSRPLPLNVASVRLGDCRHKLGPNGVFIVQGLDDVEEEERDDEDGGDEVFYTIESETDQSDSADDLAPLSSEEDILEFRQKRTLQCNQCTKTFSQPNHLKLHQRTHNKKQQVQPRPNHSHICGVCGKEFLYPSTLLIHERVHTGEKPYICGVCGHAFSQMASLKKHQSQHQEKHPLEVDTGTPTVVQEESPSTQSPGGRHKCETCGKEFRFQSLLRVHQRIHTGEKPYSCSVCGKTFSQAGNVRAHMRMHKDNDLAKGAIEGPAKGGGKAAVSRVKAHKCNECDKAFAFPALLRLHLRTHTGEKPYTCDICEKAFSQRSSLQLHELRQHNKDGHPRGRKKLQSQSALLIHQQTHSRDKPYACTLCQKRFSRPENFQIHQRWHANDLRHGCSHCGKLFVTPSKLKEHMLKHTGEKPFSCSLCSKTFTSSSGLKKHSQIHTGETPFTCSTCGKAFKFQSNLRAHEKSHSQERPCLCQVCGKTFSNSVNLSRHQKTHGDDRPHGCPHCDQKFLSATNLRRHLLRHSGQRPHLCALCGKSFARPESLKTHQRVHTKEKPYECSICGEHYSYVQTLQSHQKRAHPTQEHPENGSQRRLGCGESSGAPQNPESQCVAENI